MIDEANQVNCTDEILTTLKSALRPAHLRNVKPSASLTPSCKAMLVCLHDATLPFVSNPVIYANKIQSLGKVQQKIFLSLVLGGHFQIYRVAGPLPGDHSPHVVGAHASHHYRLRATCIVDSEEQSK